MTDVAAQLRHGLQIIARRRPRPRPFVDIGSLPWDDPVFSRHFLRTATRSQRYTNREIAFLEACGLLRAGQRILDVACGGGRHSLMMAQRGALVTGLDLGPAAIATAKRRAHKASLAVEFVQGDVRAMAYEAVFDAVTFIFGCFTEMPRPDAEAVLRRISRSLCPGGMFVLDVYAPRFFAALDGEQEWWVGHDFIAGRFPQLVLTEYFYYAREKTYARRDFIWDTRTGTIHTFGVSGQAYALPELCGMIEAAGLNPTMVYGGWQGEEVTSDSQMYVVLAVKRPSPLAEQPETLRRQETGWCPSIACIQYVQRAHACCSPPEAQDTIHLKSAPTVPVVRGDGPRSMYRSAEIASRDVCPRRGSCDARSLLPVRG